MGVNFSRLQEIIILFMFRWIFSTGSCLSFKTSAEAYVEDQLWNGTGCRTSWNIRQGSYIRKNSNWCLQSRFTIHWFHTQGPEGAQYWIDARLDWYQGFHTSDDVTWKRKGKTFDLCICRLPTVWSLNPVTCFCVRPCENTETHSLWRVRGATCNWKAISTKVLKDTIKPVRNWIFRSRKKRLFSAVSWN